MPEGDTLWQAAARLEPALTGRRIVRFFSPLPELRDAELAGVTVTKVFARGKNLVIELDDGRAIHTHLRMQGKWYVREKARMNAEQLARLERAPHSLNPVLTMSIETDVAVAVCERAAVAKLASARRIQSDLATLGPDLMHPDFDAAEAKRRLREHPELPLGDAIMRQSLLAGIGNVYKSEILFLERLSPFLKVGELDDAALDSLVTRAQTLMDKNRKGPRRTMFGKFTALRFYVYERSGEHCLKCDTTIEMRRQGALQRSTYYCPHCQNVR